MWSLPNIKQMNSEAASQQNKFEKMLRSGKDVRALPEDVILTPSARDFPRYAAGVIPTSLRKTVPK